MYALRIKNLSKIYKNGIEALKNIDLTVKKGDFFALLGVNGAGKSTTIGVITTLLTKTAGKVSICGYDIDTHAVQAKSCLGVVPQEFNLNVFETCEQILYNQAGYYGISRRQVKEKAAHLLQQLALYEKRHSIVRHLSGGMKRRLMIARGLIHEPKVLILDEPTAGVDIEIRRNMWDFLNETNQAGTTIILTTHYLEEAEQLCKQVAIIDKGVIVEHTTINRLIKTLHHQTLIFTTEQKINQLPHSDIFSCIPIDSNTFEMTVDTKMPLNEVFAFLSSHDIKIHSVNNKTNRLEALFLDRIHK